MNAVTTSSFLPAWEADQLLAQREQAKAEFNLQRLTQEADFEKNAPNVATKMAASLASHIFQTIWKRAMNPRTELPTEKNPQSSQIPFLLDQEGKKWLQHLGQDALDLPPFKDWMKGKHFYKDTEYNCVQVKFARIRDLVLEIINVHLKDFLAESGNSSLMIALKAKDEFYTSDQCYAACELKVSYWFKTAQKNLIEDFIELLPWNKPSQ